MTSVGPKALVTGATGFIGRHLLRKLQDSQYSVVRCLVRSPSSVEALMVSSTASPMASSATNVEPILGSLTYQNDCHQAVAGTNVIFHCAAAKSGPIASMYYNSVVGTRNLLDAAINSDTLERFVHVSSFAVYGTAQLRAGTIVDESTPLERELRRRNDPYAYVKLKQEELVWEYRAKHGLPVVVLRPGVVYGPGGDPISRRVGIRLFGTLLNAGGRNTLPVSYVENCADAIVLAGQHTDAEGEVFNVLDGDPVSCNRFLSGYRREVGGLRTVRFPYPLMLLLSGSIDWYSRHSRGQIPPVLNRYLAASTWKRMRFSNRKLVEQLGWTQNVSTETGLGATFEKLSARHGRPE